MEIGCFYEIHTESTAIHTGLESGYPPTDPDPDDDDDDPDDGRLSLHWTVLLTQTACPILNHSNLVYISKGI